MEKIISNAVMILAYFAHLVAIIVITTGMIKALRIFVKDIFTRRKSRKAIEESRLEIGHAFSLSLGFLIGASIIKTVIAPTWNDIGKLAAIIAIRTILNFFLMRDIEDLTNKDN